MEKNRKMLIASILVLMIIISSLSVLAFEEAGSLSPEETESLPEYKIGISYYSFTDYLGSRVKKYFEYYGKEFNVKMLFAEAISAEKMLNNVENFIQRDVDGIIAIMPTEGMIKACEDAGVPVLAFGNIWSREDPENFSKYDMFAGTITEDDGVAVREMVAEVYGSGARKIAYVTPSAVDESNIRAYTLEQEINSDEYPDMEIVTSFVGMDVANAVQNMATSYPEIDAILATNGSYGTMETIFNIVYSMGLDWKMASLDIPKGAEQFFGSGQYIWSCGGQYASAGIAFAAMYDEINGNRWFEDTGEIIWRRFVNVTSQEEYKQYEKYIDGKIPNYTAQEVQDMIQVFNPEADLEMVEEINKVYSIDDVVSRHKDLLN